MEESLKQKFLPDEYIFKQGDKGNQAFLLLDGRIAIEVNGKKVSEISEMEIFGEMSLILNKPRTASVKALKPSIVLPIDEKILSSLLEKSPPIVKSMVKQLSYRLAQCDAEIRSLKKNVN
jgi:NTE family protein